jgi:hypothetical protein
VDPCASSGGENVKKGRRLSPAALPEEALVNVSTPSTNLSLAAGAAKPIIPILAKGGAAGGEEVHGVSEYPRPERLSTVFFIDGAPQILQFCAEHPESVDNSVEQHTPPSACSARKEC